MAALTLHRLSISPEAVEAEEGGHVFTFVLDPIPRPSDQTMTSRGIESNEVTYGGHAWSLVGTISRDQESMGLFLKWRYSDGATRSNVSVKVKYSMTLINRMDYNFNRTFRTTQRFTSSQSLLGKSRFVPLADLCSQSAGFLDSTGQGAVIELAMSSCRTFFEKQENIGPAYRTHHNAGGVYFDTVPFLMAGQKWYLRFYTSKTNVNGLPAVYLYLASKPRGVTITLQFTLSLADLQTELLTYGFGEGAKFDGFGKTLVEPLNLARGVQEVSVRVEVTSLIVHSVAVVRLNQRQTVPTDKRSVGASPWNLHRTSSSSSHGSTSGSTTSESVQDLDGNLWKVGLIRSDSSHPTLTFDKAVHHFVNSRTRMIGWSATLLSRDQENQLDVEMCGGPVISYFSNLLNDSPSGYQIGFPVDNSLLQEHVFTDESGDIYIRINFISTQTTPLVLRTSPKFEYERVHLQQARQEAISNERSLADMKDMSASRASLSLILPSSSSSTEDLSFVSDSAATSKSNNNNNNNNNSAKGDNGSNISSTFYKSSESIVELTSAGESNNTQVVNGHKNLDVSQTFISTLLHSLVASASSHSDDATLSRQNSYLKIAQNPDSMTKDYRNGSHTGLFSNTSHVGMTTNNLATSHHSGNRVVEGNGRFNKDGGLMTSDPAQLVAEARLSNTDLNSKKDAVNKLVRILQRLPLRITEIVEGGSLFTGVSCCIGTDAVLTILSQDVPQVGQSHWMEAILKSVQAHIEHEQSINHHETTPLCHDFIATWRHLMLKCLDVEVEVRVSYDWQQKSRNHSSGSTGSISSGRSSCSSTSSCYESLYSISCKNGCCSVVDRYWFSVACAKLQKSFVFEQPNEVKELIKVVLQWSNRVKWRETSYRPDSYLLSLLIIKAAQELNSSNLIEVLRKTGSYVLAPELSISWNKFYDPDKYPVTFDPPTPLIRDPGNPVYNVASSLTYWGQLRTEYLLWMKQLNITV